MQKIDFLIFSAGCTPVSGRNPCPPDFHADLLGNSRGHPCGNFLCISLGKFSRNKGEFSMRIFPPLLSRIPADIFSWKFPSYFPQNFKMNRTGPSCVKISQCWFDVIVWWIRMFSGFGQLPSHFNRDLKTFPGCDAVCNFFKDNIPIC